MAKGDPNQDRPCHIFTCQTANNWVLGEPSYLRPDTPTAALAVGGSMRACGSSVCAGSVSTSRNAVDCSIGINVIRRCCASLSVNFSRSSCSYVCFSTSNISPSSSSKSRATVSGGPDGGGGISASSMPAFIALVGLPLVPGFVVADFVPVASPPSPLL